jgi:VWFA-related protein
MTALCYQGTPSFEVNMLLGLLVSAVALSSGQERKPPEFRSDVRMIRLDVSATDRKGRPVAGLLPADFKVTEDGRPVEIAFFEAVASATAGAPAANDETLLAALPARRMLILVDADSMTTTQLIRARESTARFLRESTAEGDWVRLVDLSSGRAVDGHIPEDRVRLESAARLLRRGASIWGGDGGRQSDPIVDRVERVRSAEGPGEASTTGRFLSTFAEASGLLGNLESLLIQLNGVEGRKALVLVSPGFPQLQDLDQRLEKVASLAREAATAIYFVDSAGLDGLIPERGRSFVPVFEAVWGRSGGAQDLAAATGGFTSRLSNSLVAGLSRAASEMRTYYVLGYLPSRPDDGRFRELKVRVNVPGIEARTKKGYLAGKRR